MMKGGEASNFLTHILKGENSVRRKLFVKLVFYLGAHHEETGGVNLSLGEELMDHGSCYCF